MIVMTSKIVVNNASFALMDQKLYNMFADKLFTDDLHIISSNFSKLYTGLNNYKV